MASRRIYIGFDRREVPAFAVAQFSAKHHMREDQIPVRGLVLDNLIDAGFYDRPTTIWHKPDGTKVMIDELSKRDDYDGAISTEFAISRFFVPMLARHGWALFMDCDMLVRTNLNDLFCLADDRYAVMCVKHHHESSVTVKMDGQPQTNYHRKNWSSVMLFNCEHPSNKKLTPALLNSAPGRDLHAFCWLEDHEIGELPLAWNWLAGESQYHPSPKIVHHTLGSPCMKGYENAPYADEWRARLAQWGQWP
jgi:lipopolysaccharide biosynthesis glycosyltransferase